MFGGNMRTKSIILMLATLLLGSMLVSAQTTGSISGTVVDVNGALVPNAKVVVRGPSGQEFTAVTTANGTYRIPAVANGLYIVSITADGFKSAKVSDVKVDVGTASTVNATLEVGAVDQVVEVVGGGEVLQTQAATVGTTMAGRQIIETPIQSRDALDLVVNLPGTNTIGTVLDPIFSLRRRIRIAPGSMFSNSGRYEHCMRLACTHPVNELMDRAMQDLGAMACRQLGQNPRS
jgi:hypothetical protein